MAVKNSSTKFPHPSRLERHIELPPGAVKEIAAWMGVSVRTVYEWMSGAKPSKKSMQLIHSLTGLPREHTVDQMRMYCYSAWYKATFEPGVPAVWPEEEINEDTEMEDLL